MHNIFIKAFGYFRELPYLSYVNISKYKLHYVRRSRETELHIKFFIASFSRNLGIINVKNDISYQLRIAELQKSEKYHFLPVKMKNE